MATILRSHYAHALEQFQYAESTAKDDEIIYLADMMRGNELLRSAGILAKEDLNALLEHEKQAPQEQRTAHKILKLLSEQAALLPSNLIRNEGPTIDIFSVMVESAAGDAKEGGARQIQDQLVKLNQMKVYPRSDQQIQKLIECKKQLQSLSNVFSFCCDVEALYNPVPELQGNDLVFPQPPTRGRIERLKERLKEIDSGQNFRALEIAKKQLDELASAAPKPPPLFADLHPGLLPNTEPPARIDAPKKSSHWGGRTWACIAGAAIAAIALHALYRRFS